MSLTLVVACSTADANYFFSWFVPFLNNNHNEFKYLIVLNGSPIESLPLDLSSKSVKIISISQTLRPGEARNIALSHIQDGHVSFIDARTIIVSDWLVFARDFCRKYPNSSCLGSILFFPSRPWHLPLISSTYGFNQILCLPGSIIHRQAFSQAGFFLPNVRAGEDLDWIWHASSHKLFLDIGMPPPLKYNLDSDKSIFFYFRKWFRNYSCTSTLPYVSDTQRTFYAFFLFVTLSLLAYFWNSLFADWVESSPFYIPFISRSVVATFVSIYLFFRCLYLPIKKGTSYKVLIRYFWLVVLFSIALDFVKLAAFLPSILHKFGDHIK